MLVLANHAREHIIISGNSSPLLYDLVAMTNHHGLTMGSGHYTAYRKGGTDWKVFNNTVVRDVTPSNYFNVQFF